MIPQESMLVVLVKLIDRIPTPPAGPAKRGRPITYPEKLFLKALVIMIVKHLQKVHELLSVLNEPTLEMEQLRNLLTEKGRYPTRRTWERRLKGLPASLPAQIGFRALPGEFDRSVGNLRTSGGIGQHRLTFQWRCLAQEGS